MHQDDQDNVHGLFNETDVPENPTEEGMFEKVHLEQVEHQYSTILQESSSSTSMPLLPPAVLVPIEDKESFS